MSRNLSYLGLSGTIPDAWIGMSSMQALVGYAHHPGLTSHTTRHPSPRAASLRPPPSFLLIVYQSRPPGQVVRWSSDCMQRLRAESRMNC